MGAMRDQAEAIAAELTEAGVRATLDPRNVNPPCLLIEAVPERDFTRKAAIWSARVFGPGPANLDWADSVDELIDAAADILPLNTGRLDPYPLPGTGELTTTYLLTWEGSIDGDH